MRIHFQEKSEWNGEEEEQNWHDREHKLEYHWEYYRAYHREHPDQVYARATLTLCFGPDVKYLSLYSFIKRHLCHHKWISWIEI